MPFKGVTILDLVTWAFAAYMFWNMIDYLRAGELRRDMMVFRTLRGGNWRWLIPGIPLLLVTTFGLAFFLYDKGGQIMQFSWTQLLATTEAEKAKGGGNLMVGGLQIPIVAGLFIPLLLLNIPRLARREEEVFRRGIRSPRAAALRSLQFGLMHCIVGVPVAVGFALAWPGLVFSYIYTKGGTRLSTSWHAVYNWSILVLLGIYFLTKR